MKKCLSLAGIAALALEAGTASAAINSNDAGHPYDSIIARNVFDIHPALIQTTSTPPPVLPRVHLIGLCTILGCKQAYFAVQTPAAPGKPAAPDKYFTLLEGQSADMLEVVAIDVRNRQVTIKTNGELSTVTFDSYKIQPSPSTVQAVPPSAGTLQMTVNPTPFTSSGNLSQRIGATQPASGQMEPDAQTVLMELQREATKEAVAAGQMPPLPPTKLSEIMQQEQSQPATGGTAPNSPLPSFPRQHNTIK